MNEEPLIQISGKSFNPEDQKALLERLRSEISLREHFQKVAASNSLFLANMSHEIRTPLGLILGFTEELINSSQLTPANRYLIHIIQRNSEMLARLINDILDFSKTEAGKLDFNIAPIQTSSLIKELSMIFKTRCGENHLPFQLEILTPLPETFYSDEVRLKQILMNLICNSLKHTEHGSLILKISYDESAALFYFDVFDSGEGIPTNLQSDIFETFKQLHNDKPGSGLGLPLSLNLAKGLQGNLILKHSQPGQGSWFRVEIKNQSIPEKLQPNSDRCGTEASWPNLCGCRILIVDDLIDNIRLLECILRPTQALVDSTTSAQEALQKVQAQSYDLILLDLMMPEMDGFKVLDLLKASGFSGEVWAVSAHALNTQKKECLTSGFSQHISKPIQRKSFYKKLQQLSQAQKMN